MRLIDADELIKVIQKRWGGVPLLSTKAIDQADIIISDIDAQPTVDQWHYPAKGEVPEKDGEYLCRYYKYDLCFSKVALYRVKDNKWYHLLYNAEYRIPKPDAWQHIVPPKEEVNG